MQEEKNKIYKKISFNGNILKYTKSINGEE